MQSMKMEEGIEGQLLMGLELEEGIMFSQMEIIIMDFGKMICLVELDFIDIKIIPKHILESL